MSSVYANNRRSRISSHSPFITYGIIAICGFLYLLPWLMRILHMPGDLDVTIPRDFAFMPFLGWVEPWRMLTTAFLHGSLMHLAFNMLALYMVGVAIEDALGHARFILLYIISALAGSLAVLLWVFVEPASLVTWVVGASGAVFGLFGAVFVIQKFHGADTRAIVALLLVNFVYGFMQSGIAWQAHVGGLVVGAFATWVMVLTARNGNDSYTQPKIGRSFAAGVAVSAVLIILIGVTYRCLETYLNTLIM